MEDHSCVTVPYGGDGDITNGVSPPQQVPRVTNHSSSLEDRQGGAGSTFSDISPTGDIKGPRTVQELCGDANTWTSL